MAVLDPVKLIIDNYPEGQIEDLEADEQSGERGAWKHERFRSARELYIDREDFMENPPKKYFRLFPGNEVRLMNAYFVKCTGFEKDENGNVTEIHCTYDPETKCGTGFTGRKVKGTIHWVAAKTANKGRPYVSMRTLSMKPKAYITRTAALNLNPNSLTVKRMLS